MSNTVKNAEYNTAHFHIWEAKIREYLAFFGLKMSETINYGV